MHQYVRQKRELPIREEVTQTPQKHLVSAREVTTKIEAEHFSTPSDSVVVKETAQPTKNLSLRDKLNAQALTGKLLVTVGALPILSAALKAELSDFAYTFGFSADTSFNENLGNIWWSCLGVPLLAELGQKHLPSKIRPFAGEVALLATAAYFTLGESLLPWILPGTAEVKDIPAAIIGACMGWVWGNQGYKSLLEQLKIGKSKADNT